MSFANLGLSEALVRAVADAGYSQPTPIQTQAIPVVLSGADLMAGAQTGTGKTAAFVLPLLQRLATPAPAGDAQKPAGGRAGARKIRALILAPTRELAAQVEESVRVYGKHSGLSSLAVFGGVSINPQIDRLRRGVDVLVATPGRLLDHHGQRTLDLSGVEVLVLDEADRMLDMGFLPDIKRILAALPRKRQNLLFSATFADEIRELANSLLTSPVSVQVTPRNSTVESVKQSVHPVDAGRKAELLVHLVKEGNWFQVLVFTRTKHGANKLAQRLEKSDIPALAIHGNKSQNARTRALADFKSAKLQVLVATDIAARGLDIEQLPHVVNFDIPHVPEDYVHRIGRTGRAGAIGEAVSLVCAEENGRLRDIERLIKRSLPRVVVPGFEAGRPGSQPPEVIESAQRQERKAPSGRGSREQRKPRPAHAARPGASRTGERTEGRPSRSGAGAASRGKPRVAEGTAPQETRTNGRGSGPSHASSSDRRNSPHSPARAPEHARGERNGHGPSNGAPPAERTAHANAKPRRDDARGELRSGDRRPAKRASAQAQGSSLVRNNLPPGWTTPGSAPRRGR